VGQLATGTITGNGPRMMECALDLARMTIPGERADGEVASCRS
jgi:hypothetical protein